MAAKMRELEMIGRKKRSKVGKTVASLESENTTSPSSSEMNVTRRREGRKKGVGSVKKRSSKTRNVARLVMSLSCHGFEEQLAWLEAYLQDEARDRTVDGECVVGWSVRE